MNNDNYDQLIIFINFLKREKIIHLVEAIKSESFDTMSKKFSLKILSSLNDKSIEESLLILMEIYHM